MGSDRKEVGTGAKVRTVANFVNCRDGSGAVLVLSEGLSFDPHTVPGEIGTTGS